MTRVIISNSLIRVAAVAAAFTIQTAQAGDTPADRLASLRQAGSAASMTVFPVMLLEKPVSQVGDVLGIMLEQAGMENIESTDVAATVTPGADPAKSAAEFGAFVVNHSIKTDYALFAEFIGTRQTGFTEVHTVIVDKSGAEVWSDRQTKSDVEFRRINPTEPMQCCLLVSDRVKSAMRLSAPPAASKGPGKIEKRFSEKAGMPSDAERSDMAPRLAALRQLGGNAAIEVYPVQIGGKVDAEAARHLATLLNEAGLCKALPANSSPVFKLNPTMNEQTRLWDLARASRKQMKAHPGEAPYTLFAEYMINEKTNAVGAVHFVVCDRTGEWVIVDFQNNHHEDFNRIAPRTTADCGQFVLKRLNGLLK